MRTKWRGTALGLSVGGEQCTVEELLEEVVLIVLTRPVCVQPSRLTFAVVGSFLLTQQPKLCTFLASRGGFLPRYLPPSPSHLPAALNEP